MDAQTPPSIYEASIQDLASALQSGQTTAVGLIAKCLLRISTYDCRNTSLNSVPLLNPNVFDEAAASDDRRRKGQSLGLLDGIPFTVKDSYKVRGMTVASGSQAFKDLVANEDAFTVQALRKAGAVLIGKTNMCPMAFGGMQRGVYGRAESPYNSKYLAAAFASGSSNGSGVSTAASFAAFGMGEETVSSGRSPASNNGLVAYTPSRGLISIRGNWPLYPTCDTVVPHTRSMDDLFDILDVLTMEDERTAGDFWRDQPFVEIPKAWRDRPKSFKSIKTPGFLRGKRIGVPDMFLGDSKKVYTSEAVRTLFDKARSNIEACGAFIESCSTFPAITAYEDPTALPKNIDPEARLPDDWNFTERGPLIAYSWDDFLRANKDPNIPTISAADSTKLFPRLPPDHPQVKFSEVRNAVHWSKLASYAENNTDLADGSKSKMYDITQLGEAVKALELMRKTLLEDWMAENKYDFLVFPAAGDVGYADADVDVELAEHTWKWGVRYSNGNRALRHLGIPSVTVPMGMILGKDMPMGLTIVGKAYEDVEILKAGYAFEQSIQHRVAPILTPRLGSDVLGTTLDEAEARPELQITSCRAYASGEKECRISIDGSVTSQLRSLTGVQPCLDIFVDAHEVPKSAFEIRSASASEKADVFDFSCSFTTPVPQRPDTRNEVVGRIARDSIMIVVLARNRAGDRPSGYMQLIHMDDVVRN
jgi:amidase